MILVDYRQGSHELVEPLASLGLDVVETTLDFGDVAFEGRGVGGTSVLVGIEFKKLAELVGSMRTGRLQGHQVPGMCDEHAGYDYRWLLIEGELLYDQQGRLLQKRVRRGRTELSLMPGSMRIGEFLKRLHVMYLCAGVVPIWAKDRRMTLTQIEMLYRTWTDADLDDHKSHLATYTPPSIVPLNNFRSVVQKLPGVGPAVSLAAQKKFKTLRRALTAGPDAWAVLELVDKNRKSKHLGMKVARTIEETLTHEH